MRRSVFLEQPPALPPLPHRQRQRPPQRPPTVTSSLPPPVIVMGGFLIPTLGADSPVQTARFDPIATFCHIKATFLWNETCRALTDWALYAAAPDMAGLLKPQGADTTMDRPEILQIAPAMPVVADQIAKS